MLKDELASLRLTKLESVIVIDEISHAKLLQPPGCYYSLLEQCTSLTLVWDHLVESQLKSLKKCRFLGLCPKSKVRLWNLHF